MNKPRSFGLHFGLAMTLYALLLLGAAIFIRANPETPWRYILAILPVLPGIYAAWSVSEEISRRDELQQKMQLEALSFAFGGTALVTLAIGLLDMAGVEQLNGAWYVPIMMALWGLGQWIAKRKYR
ncbi:MAG: hypothetical protein DWQ07_04250 [Chloroflexi bacterium]|nr:MAG: hypothetical protein DWQ07_04250 [Chloroflexota bacterium]MBL1194644.1 hypothetical protein [Chloroflexota bacterium]NOH11934.1 hypothetical protein [Chloroflexota bacterium]